MTHGRLESHLRAQRDAGRKLLVPYVTGGLEGWVEAIQAAAAHGADAIEVGIPFSDPVMDGPVIQAASERALRAGATPLSILDRMRTIDVQIPLLVMCYFNTVHAMGLERFAGALEHAHVAGAIIPDLPLEEVGPWTEHADRHNIETVLLAAPTAPDERLPRIIERCRGFVYAVGLLGVTGERAELSSTAIGIAGRLKKLTDMPVLVGVGVSNAEQAREAVRVADGVIQGASVVRRLMESGAEEVGRYIAEVREAIDDPALRLQH